MHVQGVPKKRGPKLNSYNFMVNNTITVSLSQTVVEGTLFTNQLLTSQKLNNIQSYRPLFLEKVSDSLVIYEQGIPKCLEKFISCRY